MQSIKGFYRNLDPAGIGLTVLRSLNLALAALFVFLLVPSFAAAQALELSQNGNGNSSLTAGGTTSKISTGTSQSVGQTPLLIIKNNTAVSSVTQGWAVGTQNAATNVVIPSHDVQGPGATVSIMQNPTGTNVKNNVSALTQPPTIVVSLPTCVGGQILVGNVCACTGGFVWNGSNCVPPVTCASVLPSNTSTSQTCTAFYGSSAWSGNVLTNTTWSCPSTYASPVSSVSNNTSGCTPLTACSSIKPADSSSSQTCNAYYSASSWDGNVVTTTTWTCPSMYGTPTSAVSVNTSGCTPKVVTCTAGSVANAPVACGAGYNGGTKFTTKTTTCPSGIYGAPSVTTSGYNTTGCIACPSSFNTSFTPTCPVNTTAVANSGVKTTSYSCSTGTAVSSISITNSGTCTANPVTCTVGSTTESQSCSAGYTGTQTRTKSTSCPSGSYGSPTITYTAWSGTCTATCTNNSVLQTVACDAGYTGNKTRTATTNSCTGVTSYTAWDTSACVLKPITYTYEYPSGSCAANAGNGYVCEIGLYCSAGFTIVSVDTGGNFGVDTSASTYHISRFRSGAWDADFNDFATCRKQN